MEIVWWTLVNTAQRTRGAAVAEGPRNGLCQFKSCQLLHNCAINHILKAERTKVLHLYVAENTVYWINVFPRSNICKTLK